MFLASIDLTCLNFLLSVYNGLLVCPAYKLSHVFISFIFSLLQVFKPILSDIRSEMTIKSAVSDRFNVPIQTLADLLEIKAQGATNSWPICELVCAMENWLPSVTVNGHKLQHDTFLGPFFALSAISDDSVSLQKVTHACSLIF